MLRRSKNSGMPSTTSSLSSCRSFAFFGNPSCPANVQSVLPSTVSTPRSVPNLSSTAKHAMDFVVKKDVLQVSRIISHSRNAFGFWFSSHAILWPCQRIQLHFGMWSSTLLQNSDARRGPSRYGRHNQRAVCYVVFSVIQ